PGPVMIAGEGIETLLSLRQIMPRMPMIAGLSAAHLAATLFPACLKRLYVARDDGPAGAGALKTLIRRATPAGIEVLSLEPRLDDFTSDLCSVGRARLAARLAGQLHRADVSHLLMRG